MRHRLRVLRAHTLAWIGFVRLALAISRGKVDQVWIGDSNAVFSGADRFPPLGVGTTADRRWVWHLGPRLMYSMASGGFKPGMHRAFRILGRLPHSHDVVWLFSFGEIDIRCHLAPRVKDGDPLDFIPRYVSRLQELVADLGAPFGICVVPVPTAVESLVHDSFPVVGTNEERRVAHGVVRKRVLEATDALDTTPAIIPLDLTDALSDEDGWYWTKLHSDGVHPNAAGRVVVQRELQQLLADR